MLNICNKLNISKTKDAYATPERVIEGVKDYFEWYEIPSTVAAASNWNEKPCFKCIIGLLDKYCNFYKKQRDINVLNEFTLFCIGCCLGSGSYYIIK